MYSKAIRLHLLLLGVLTLLSGFAGCAAEDPAASAAGPGVENPAAAAPNTIVPAVGTAGNGGGSSGGGAGAAAGH